MARITVTEYVTYPAHYRAGRDPFYVYKHLRTAQARARQLGKGAQIWLAQDIVVDRTTKYHFAPYLCLTKKTKWKAIGGITR